MRRINKIYFSSFLTTYKARINCYFNIYAGIENIRNAKS